MTECAYAYIEKIQVVSSAPHNHDFTDYLILALTIKCKMIGRLSIRHLVNLEPMVGGTN
jgi:hypothetical protein